jgi:transposase-like protein
MAKEIPWEIRFEAEDLYISGNHTYEAVAKRTGVSVSQLKRWGQEGNWKESKKEMLESLSAIKQNTIRLRLGLIKTAMEKHEPMQVFAAEKFETLALKAMEVKQNEIRIQPEGDNKTININSPKEAINALQEIVENKLNRFLTGDEVKLSDVKDIKQSLEMIDAMKAKYNPSEVEEIKQGGLSDEAAEAIRKQILGLNK